MDATARTRHRRAAATGRAARRHLVVGLAASLFALLVSDPFRGWLLVAFAASTTCCCSVPHSCTPRPWRRRRRPRSVRRPPSVGSVQQLPVSAGVGGRAIVTNELCIRNSYADWTDAIPAEGVENTQIVDGLVALGCDSAQGYGIARPMTPRDLAAWLQSDTSPVPMAMG